MYQGAYMIKIFMGLLIVSASSVVNAAEYTTSKLICEVNPNNYSTSCVSKASIAKDEAQLELIKLQTELTKIQLEEAQAKVKKVKKTK